MHDMHAAIIMVFAYCKASCILKLYWAHRLWYTEFNINLEVFYSDAGKCHIWYLIYFGFHSHNWHIKTFFPFQRRAISQKQAILSWGISFLCQGRDVWSAYFVSLNVGNYLLNMHFPFHPGCLFICSAAWFFFGLISQSWIDSNNLPDCPIKCDRRGVDNHGKNCEIRCGGGLPLEYETRILSRES